MKKKAIKKIHRRNENTHKGDYGHAFIVAGSTGMTGAAYLASQAAILSGCGLVTLGIPANLNQVMEIKLTEVMTLPLACSKEGYLKKSSEKNILNFSKKVSAVAIGPGLSRLSEVENLVRKVLLKVNKPLVLDADGLNALSKNTQLLKKRKMPTIVTPHPGEMARLINKNVSWIQKNREEVAKKFSRVYNCVTILKGFKTIVANPKGQCFVNDSGNSGMSTAGTGDVLTGMIVSLLAQGIDVYSSSIIAVHLHGVAGDYAAKEKGQISLIAGDLLDKLPQVFKEVG